ncbi:unnamed protein product [Sphagnum jensenii]|uniref:Uncharacterized protein n=1 Tax=Sphagnum jensenii TaxID=128206 RepID=A0ABP1BHF4_9BRYO
MGVIRQPLLRNLWVHYFRQYNGLQSHLQPQSSSFSTVPQGSGVQKTKGGGGYVGLVAVTAAVAIVGGSYYTMTRTQLPTTNPSVSPQPVPSTATTYTDHNAPATSPPPTLSAHDELLNRRGELLKELAVLRTKKRDKLVDLKKKEIKEEIHIIESGLAKLEGR